MNRIQRAPCGLDGLLLSVLLVSLWPSCVGVQCSHEGNAKEQEGSQKILPIEKGKQWKELEVYLFFDQLTKSLPEATSFFDVQRAIPLLKINPKPLSDGYIFTIVLSDKGSLWLVRDGGILPVRKIFGPIGFMSANIRGVAR